MHINLSKYPSLRKTYVTDLPKLSGGLNLWELDYRISENQSPYMKNLWWQDGAIQCRDGQVYLSSSTALGTGYASSRDLFWDASFFHIGTKLYYGFPNAATFSLTDLGVTVPQNRGTFFRYKDWLFYKNRGGFFKISYTASAFSCVNVTTDAYTPVILINTDPTTHAGDENQQENRINSKKTVWYNATGVTEYKLPVVVDSIYEVTVGGTVVSNYSLNSAHDAVVFTTAPAPAETNNGVRITYSKANTDAYNSVMDCPYAIVSGGDAELCIVLGGSTAQPNAIFWNSNDTVSMNPSYWPADYYNLVDDTEDPVTGFGKQYQDTIVFKEHSIVKLAYGTVTVSDLDLISFTYTSLNSKVGCDLPWSIQTIENNIVFCNTYRGVHYIQSTSAAYENNVICISRNVNGVENVGSRSQGIRGLIYDVRNSDIDVTSFDDDFRYWLCANGNVYLWDYSLSSTSDPSWFYFTNMDGISYFTDDEHKSYHLNTDGQITKMVRSFSDYGNAIDKVYQFPTFNFGSYDRLKDILNVVISVRSDTETEVSIRYDCDYTQRNDPTDITTWEWVGLPYDLTGTIVGYYNLVAPLYARVAKRVPGLFHVRHFSFQLSNNSPGKDLAIISAQVYYRFTEKER